MLRPWNLVIQPGHRDVAVLDKRLVERAVKQGYRDSGHPLEVGCEFEALVAKFNVEAEIEAWKSRAEHPHNILRVNDIVPVLVLVLHVARTYGGEGLLRGIVDFHLAGEEAYGLKSVALAHTVALVVEIVVLLICLVVIDDLSVEI